MTREAVLDRLRRLHTDDESTIDLAETALLLAACDRPEADLNRYRSELTRLVDDVRTATGADAGLAARVAALRRVFVEGHGYRGDEETYDDPRNANLIDVIDRRRGLPVALGLLVIHAFRGAGGLATGMNFPSHFVVRLEARSQRAIVDPFAGLALMEAPDLRRRLKTLVGEAAEIRPEHWSDVSDREIVLRMQNNVKVRALAAGDVHRALQILETMTVIAPERLDCWWDTAILFDRLADTAGAVRALENYLAFATPGSQAARVEDLLQRLRKRLS